jgi:hypothetical protein
MKVVELAVGDVYIHSYVLGLESLVHTSSFRIVDRHMGWEVAQVQFAKMLSRNHAGSLGIL